MTNVCSWKSLSLRSRCSLLYWISQFAKVLLRRLACLLVCEWQAVLVVGFTLLWRINWSLFFSKLRTTVFQWLVGNATKLYQVFENRSCDVYLCNYCCWRHLFHLQIAVRNYYCSYANGFWLGERLKSYDCVKSQRFPTLKLLKEFANLSNSGVGSNLNSILFITADSKFYVLLVLKPLHWHVHLCMETWSGKTAVSTVKLLLFECSIQLRNGRSNFTLRMFLTAMSVALWAWTEQKSPCSWHFVSNFNTGWSTEIYGFRHGNC